MPDGVTDNGLIGHSHPLIMETDTHTAREVKKLNWTNDKNAIYALCDELQETTCFTCM